MANNFSTVFYSKSNFSKGLVPKLRTRGNSIFHGTGVHLLDKNLMDVGSLLGKCERLFLNEDKSFPSLTDVQVRE